MYYGVTIDGIAIFFGGLLGLLLNKGIPEHLEKSVMNAVAVSAIFIGVQGMGSGENTILIILAMVFGVVIGEVLGIDNKVNFLADKLSDKMAYVNSESTFSEGLITGFLLMGVGALSIMGPLESGLTGTHDIMMTNAVIDGVTSIILASSLGIGVMFSAVPVFLSKAITVIFAGSLNTLMTDVMINDINAIGGILVMLIGLNLLEVTDLKIMNFIPAIFIPIALFFLY